MIPSLRSDDYRSFFKCSSPIHLLIDFILEIISYTLGTTLESKSLMKNGIMIPSPRNGVSTIGPYVLIALRAGKPCGKGHLFKVKRSSFLDRDYTKAP
ncbi:unnamed protein product [Arabidopsis thaliana]|uniref:(thale cress) hypothetical protein n=1 Tax=Arabidopsis thaliana TaxID=3702 RepID=A0A7G2F9U2_ARATH|nr:unnamed protein product [Arabidopsis thaliana]